MPEILLARKGSRRPTHRIRTRGQPLRLLQLLHEAGPAGLSKCEAVRAAGDDIILGLNLQRHVVALRKRGVGIATKMVTPKKRGSVPFGRYSLTDRIVSIQQIGRAM